MPCVTVAFQKGKNSWWQVSSGWNTWVIVAFVLFGFADWTTWGAGCKVQKCRRKCRKSRRWTQSWKEEASARGNWLDFLFSCMLLSVLNCSVFCLQALFFCNLQLQLLSVFWGDLQVYQCCIQKTTVAHRSNSNYNSMQYFLGRKDLKLYFLLSVITCTILS